MEIINIHHPVNADMLPIEPTVMVLGYFDGIHLGHQEVIKTAKKVADEKNLPLAVLTFTQHPSIVFEKFNQSKMMKHLISPEDRMSLFKALGVDMLYLVEFTSAFSKISPEAFVNLYLRDFRAEIVVCGFDYTFGKNADTEKLKKIANDIEIIVVPKFSIDNQKVSSTRVREALEVGDVNMSQKLLGRPYQFSGLVVHGEARGRTLGFPTANLELEKYVYEPEVGVYVVDVVINDMSYRGAASIGYNDTFGDNLSKTIEIYILDFNEEIYGETVRVKWLSKIRGMIKFNGVEELINQLKSDETTARNYK